MEDIDEDRYVDKFRPTAMNVVHQWCSGKSFLEIMKDTQMFEGAFSWAIEDKFKQTFSLCRLGDPHNAQVGGAAA